MPVSTDVVLVIATIVGILAVSSIVAGWTARRWPFVAMISLVIALGLGAYVHSVEPEGLAPADIPDAFISVAARILN